MDLDEFRMTAVKLKAMGDMKSPRRATWDAMAGSTPPVYTTSSNTQDPENFTKLASLQLPPSNSIQRPTTAIRKLPSAACGPVKAPSRSSYSCSARSVNSRYSYTPVSKGKTFASGGSLRSPHAQRLANMKRWDPQTRNAGPWDGLRHVSDQILLVLSNKPFRLHWTGP